jgi:hypothetical protein
MQKRTLWCGASIVLLAASASTQTNTFPTSGNVGIGTTTPTQALTVNGNIIGSDIYLRSDAAGSPNKNVNISPFLLYEGMISGNGTTPTPWGLNLFASPWTWGQDPITYHGGFHEFRVAGGNTNEKAVMDINGGGIVLLNGSTLIFPDGTSQTTAYTAAAAALDSVLAQSGSLSGTSTDFDNGHQSLVI